LTMESADKTSLLMKEIVFGGMSAGFFYSIQAPYRKKSQELEASRAEEVELRKKADAGSEAKTRFLSTMSHELRTPLNAIINYIAIVADMTGENLTPRQKKQLQFAKENAHNLLDLINQILDIARIEAGSYPVTKTQVFPEKIAEEALKTISVIAEQKNIKVETLFTESTPGVILTDLVMVKQVIINLMNNAVKFTPSGGQVSLEITSFRREEENQRYWQLIVSDTGRGMTPEETEIIFERFRQVQEGGDREQGGSGLGLSIVKTFVDLLDGKITVESEPGVGSKFIVTFPYGEEIQPKGSSENQLESDSSLPV
jgi:signal transduction histidine kinase